MIGSALDQLICSTNTVDCYNPKAIQSSMGSIARVSCHYVSDLLTYIDLINKPIFKAEINGTSIYKNQLQEYGTYVFGRNLMEFQKRLKSNIKNKIGIPNFKKHNGAESLNVAHQLQFF